MNATSDTAVQIRVGYELSYLFPQPTPVLLVVGIHYSRASDIVRPDHVTMDPPTSVRGYRDSFGNWCHRAVCGAGALTLRSDAVVLDLGTLDPLCPDAWQHEVDTLPVDTLPFLLGSRYCETDRLQDVAWERFAQTPPGWARVQAICDFVHHHIEFGYAFARPTMTAWDVFQERRGVCRDFAHLAVALCRCMNIPARYCSGYLTDIGVPLPHPPMDFAGWFEAFLGGQWHTFDPRNNVRRRGRILIAHGRDAADVAMVTTFGPSTLQSFRVWAEVLDGVSAAGAETRSS